MANNLIDTSLGDIVIQEKPIRVTDEKLSNMLSKTYEQARKDACKFKFYKHYGVFLSMAGTLFITLLTTTFHDFLGIDSKTISAIFWVAFVLTLITGIILAVICASKQRNDENDERDLAVEKILNNIKDKRQ